MGVNNMDILSADHGSQEKDIPVTLCRSPVGYGQYMDRRYIQQFVFIGDQLHVMTVGNLLSRQLERIGHCT